MSASSRSSIRATICAAVSPLVGSNRMSRGPSWEKASPRVGSSTCVEAKPRSAKTAGFDRGAEIDGEGRQAVAGKRQVRRVPIDQQDPSTGADRPREKFRMATPAGSQVERRASGPRRQEPHHRPHEHRHVPHRVGHGAALRVGATPDPRIETASSTTKASTRKMNGNRRRPPPIRMYAAAAPPISTRPSSKP